MISLKGIIAYTAVLMVLLWAVITPAVAAYHPLIYPNAGSPGTNTDRYYSAPGRSYGNTGFPGFSKTGIMPGSSFGQAGSMMPGTKIPDTYPGLDSKRLAPGGDITAPSTSVPGLKTVTGNWPVKSGMNMLPGMTSGNTGKTVIPDTNSVASPHPSGMGPSSGWAAQPMSATSKKGDVVDMGSMMKSDPGGRFLDGGKYYQAPDGTMYKQISDARQLPFGTPGQQPAPQYEVIGEATQPATPTNPATPATPIASTAPTTPGMPTTPAGFPSAPPGQTPFEPGNDPAAAPAADPAAAPVAEPAGGATGPEPVSDASSPPATEEITITPCSGVCTIDPGSKLFVDDAGRRCWSDGGRWWSTVS